MHKTELIFSDDDDAPDVYVAGSSSTQVLCKLTNNLHRVPEHLWQSKTNSSGLRYQRLSFEIGMQIESGGLRFDCMVDGVVYGQAVAEFK